MVLCIARGQSRTQHWTVCNQANPSRHAITILLLIGLEHFNTLCYLHCTLLRSKNSVLIKRCEVLFAHYATWSNSSIHNCRVHQLSYREAETTSKPKWYRGKDSADPPQRGTGHWAIMRIKNNYNYKETMSLCPCPTLDRRNRAQNTQRIPTSKGHANRKVQHNTKSSKYSNNSIKPRIGYPGKSLQDSIARLNCLTCWNNWRVVRC